MTQSKKSKPKQPVNQSPLLSDSTWQVHQFTAFGTSWSVGLPAHLDQASQTAILADVVSRLDQFDQAYSRFRPDSLVMKMSQTVGTYQMPTDFGPLWSVYQQLAEVSQGLFTPFIGSVLSDAGYDATYSLTTKQLHTPPGWEAVDFSEPNLTIHQPVLLDFGAAGKGYAVDLIADLLKKQTENFFIDASGDILHRNQAQALRVGLEYPLNQNQAIGIAQIANQSICGSASNRRQWGNFHHMINPKTLSSPKHILATWVVADTTMLADALSTCLFFCHPAILAETFDFEYAIVYANQSLRYSPAFPAEFFS